MYTMMKTHLLHYKLLFITIIGNKIPEEHLYIKMVCGLMMHTSTLEDVSKTIEVQGKKRDFCLEKRFEEGEAIGNCPPTSKLMGLMYSEKWTF